MGPRVDGETTTGRLAALAERAAALPRFPLALLGLGVYRTWLNVLFDSNPIEGFGGLLISQNAFDVVMVAVLLACVILARRLTPLYPRRWPAAACLALMLASTLCGFAAYWVPAAAPAALWLCTVGGGAGTALVILLWSEAYGRLSPTKICLCYACSLVVGALLGWVLDGVDAVRLPVLTCALPVVSLACLRSCYRSGALGGEPAADGWASFSFPWKPVLVIAVYSFAYGLLQSSVSFVSRSNESAGTLVCSLLVAALVALVTLAATDAPDRAGTDFGALYGTVLPFMSAVFLILAALPEWSPWTRNLFANWGYTSSQIFIMTMVGSICYRWGASAVWLFGIERAVRQVAMIAGRTAEGALVAAGFSITPVLVVAVLVATLVVLRESRLDSAWGVEIEPEQAEPDRSHAVEERCSLAHACSQLAGAHNLSQREGEVLLLLAQHKTARDIETELYVANGTAKAHIRHVYQKLDIHTREELFDAVEQARGRRGGQPNGAN